MPVEENVRILNHLRNMNEVHYNNFKALADKYGPVLDSGALVRAIGYTPHDTTHCNNIYRILSGILPKTFYEKYSNGDNLFVLVVGVLLHDYAMALDVSDETRRKHSEIAKEIIIKELYSENDTFMKGHIPREYADALVEIIYAHSDIKGEHNEVDKYTLQEIVKKHDEEGLRPAGEEELNVPYLAAVLRLADELDLDYNRVYKVGYEQKYNIESSKEHFDKCMYFKMAYVRTKNPRELILEVDKNVYEHLAESEQQTASAQIIKTYEKVQSEFEQMKLSVLFNTQYASGIWEIEKIVLIDESTYRATLQKKNS